MKDMMFAHVHKKIMEIQELMRLQAGNIKLRILDFHMISNLVINRSRLPSLVKEEMRDCKLSYFLLIFPWCHITSTEQLVSHKLLIQQQLGKVSPILKVFADYVDGVVGTNYPVEYGLWTVGGEVEWWRRE
ncbi:unnamed protein product [Linum trigynum]|uniref:Uncharacterized protein n=1 Tax=Linum trigynum TaxID=586398 RepID=A0AAV2FZB3_9ROSI